MTLSRRLGRVLCAAVAGLAIAVPPAGSAHANRVWDRQVIGPHSDQELCETRRAAMHDPLNGQVTYPCYYADQYVYPHYGPGWYYVIYVDVT